MKKVIARLIKNEKTYLQLSNFDILHEIRKVLQKYYLQKALLYYHVSCKAVFLHVLLHWFHNI